METILPQIIFTLSMGIFLLAIFMHVVRQNTTLVNLYLVQSLALSFLLILFAMQNNEQILFLTAFLTIVIKVILAPAFFYRLINKEEVHFTSSAYLSTPLTLISIMAITGFAYSPILNSLHAPLIVSSIFISLFLIINRKGALSQIIGVLSLENGIVLLAALLQLRQSFILELGITFDIVIWILIAAIFITMLHKQFGSIDISKMNKLKEE